MFNRLSSLIVPALLLAASSASARSAPAAGSCVLKEYGALAAQPFSTEENYGLGGYSHLRGAQVYVPAQRGLTAEWLAADVERAMASSNECKPHVSTVHVDVVPSGPGFWVVLSASSIEEANVVLRWAQSIAPAVSAE
jgi:hypothetical protein